MLRVMSNAVELVNLVKIRCAHSPRRTRVSSCQHTRIDRRSRFLITSAKLNAQHNVHMLRVGYELVRFSRDDMIQLFFPGMASGGRLELFPENANETLKAGPKRSFFKSCIPISTHGPVGDSRTRAKHFSWKQKQRPPIGHNWVTVGSSVNSR